MGFREALHPERQVGGFTKHDGVILFYNFVKAAIFRSDAKRVLDFGAGRGVAFESGKGWRQEVQDLRFAGGELWAADVDPVVKEHPASDHQVVLKVNEPLPFEDSFFDVIVSDFTFEHIDDPELVAAELFRILRPGGWICARTVNRYGYIKMVASMVPNKLHTTALKSIQPTRQAQDVFPTVYKMNSVRQIEKLFPDGTIAWYRGNAEPAYFFNNGLIYRAFLLLHKILPDVFATSICFFIQKPEATSGQTA